MAATIHFEPEQDVAQAAAKPAIHFEAETTAPVIHFEAEPEPVIGDFDLSPIEPGTVQTSPVTRRAAVALPETIEPAPTGEAEVIAAQVPATDQPLRIGETPFRAPLFGKPGTMTRGAAEIVAGLGEFAVNKPEEFAASLYPPTAAAVAIRYGPELAKQWLQDVKAGLQGDQQASGRAVTMLAAIGGPLAVKKGLARIKAAQADAAFQTEYGRLADEMARESLRPENAQLFLPRSAAVVEAIKPVPVELEQAPLLKAPAAEAASVAKTAEGAAPAAAAPSALPAISKATPATAKTQAGLPKPASISLEEAQSVIDQRAAGVEKPATAAPGFESPVRENGGRTSIVLPDGTAVVGGRIHAQTFDEALRLGIATEDQLANGTSAFTRPDGTSWDLQGKRVPVSKVVNLSEAAKTPAPPALTGTAQTAAKTPAGQVEPAGVTAPTPRTEPTSAELAALPRAADPAIPAASPVEKALSATDAPVPQFVGIKNDRIDMQRGDRGLKPLMDPARKADPVLWADAMSRIEADPQLPDRLVRELYERPRPMTDVETVVVERRLMELTNDLDQARWEGIKASDAGDAAKAAEMEARAGELSDALSVVERAVGREEVAGVGGAGTLMGRAFRARQHLIREDYSFGGLERAGRQAKGFDPLKKSELELVRETAAQWKSKNDRLETALREQTAELARAEAARDLARLQAEEAKARGAVTGRVRAIVNKVGETLDQRAAAARERLKGKVLTPSPQDLLDIAEISAANLYKAGISFADWSIKMVEQFGETVRPHLDQLWKDVQRIAGEISQANKTARSAGAVGTKAITPRYVASTTRPNETVLNFGAGKPEKASGKYLHSEMVREAGGKVTEFDFGANQIGALGRKYDTVFASNVLNVQSGEPMLRRTLAQIKASMTDNGRAVFNFPESPRYSTLKPEDVARVIQEVFGSAPERVGGTKAAPLWEVGPGRRGLVERLGSKLDVRAKAAREKLKGKLLSPSPEDLLAMADIAASNLFHIGVDFAKWSAKMVEELGEAVRPHLQDLWVKAQSMLDEAAKTAAAPAATTPATPRARKGSVAARTAEQELQAAQEAISKRLKRRIAELEDKMARGEFEPKARREIPETAEIRQLRFELDQVERRWAEKLVEWKLARRPPVQKFAGNVAEAVNTVRAIRTSADFSAVLRQGAFVVLAHPVRGARSLPAMFKAFASEKAQFEIQRAIEARPNYRLMKAARLYLAEKGSSLSAMEEAYMSRWAGKIPLVKASERAYTTFLNSLRADSFDAMVRTLGRDGKVTPEQARIVANFVNVATGRGTLNFADRAATGLNTVFFAPRFVASRFQMLLGQPLYYGLLSGKAPFAGKGAFKARALVAREYARLLAGAATVYTLGTLANGEVELDPRSSDFGKLKWENTRVDPMAGLIPITVFLTRATTGEKKTLTRDKVVALRGPGRPYGGENVMDILARFVRTKLAPAPGLVLDAATGTDAIGRPVTGSSIAANAIVPITPLEIVEVMQQEESIPAAVAFAVLAIFGMGVQSFDERKIGKQR